jgi:Undecaprenyl-phosphate galactose phosphotransferase WbaP
MSANTLISPPGLAPHVARATRSDTARVPLASFCLILSDLIALSAVFCLAVWMKYSVSHDFNLKFYLEAYPAVLIFLGVFSFQGLYPGILLHPAEEMRRVFHAVSSVLLVLAAAAFVLKSGAEYSRYAFLVTWALGTPAVLVGRSLVRRCFRNMSWWSVPAIVLGSETAAQQLAKSLKNAQPGLRITGVLLENPTLEWDDDLPPILGYLSDGPSVRNRWSSRYAILAMPNRSQAELRQTIQDHCQSFHHILIVTDLPGVCCLGIVPREIGGRVGLEIPQRLSFRTPRVMKRCLDIVVSACLLLLLTPLLVAICIAIKFNSKGSILFSHFRYGRNGDAFRALKFRTMVQNADQVLAAHMERHPELMKEWERDHKLKKDPRITHVGLWLRRYSLDELPQLINILAGHMSLVGPRPIVQSEIARYATSYNLYKRVLPGLTGLWQVSGRNNTTYRERVAYDEYYIRNWSIWMDVYILARTFQAVVNAEGAY